MDVETISKMNCDMFEYWCYKIHRIALTLYTLASIQSASSADFDVFDEILEPLKTQYFASIDILTTMGCNIKEFVNTSDFVDSSKVSNSTFYNVTIETLENLPKTALFTESILKQLVLELKTKYEQDFTILQKTITM